MTVRRRPAQTRGQDQGPGVRTSHGFAFDAHPGPTSFGTLVLHDQHTLSPGCGFAAHEHRELEIVTWVVTGRLEHRHTQDRGLADASLGPGSVQHLTAGTGVRHAEHAGDVPTQVVQCWLLPDEPGRRPAYRSRQCSPTHELTEVLVLPEGSLLAARLTRGQGVDVPQAPYAHVFVTHGSLTYSCPTDESPTYARTEPLETGDALHLAGEDRVRLTASTPAELIVWVLHEATWYPDPR